MKRTGIRKVSLAQRRIIARDILFRAEILKRDGGCVVRNYGECSGPLECCHVLPKGKWPELRHSYVNAVAMCQSHHRWAHREPIGFRCWFLATFPERAAVLNL